MMNTKLSLFNGLITAAVALAISSVAAASEPALSLQVTRSPQSPIIRDSMLPGKVGVSINGPSLIRVPSWVAHPLGKYYPYFAHHEGKYLRLAYADRVKGPFRYSIRHVGLDVAGDRLVVFFSCVSHRPERILCTVVDLKGPPETWKARQTIEVLRPGTPQEGANLPLAFSRGGISLTYVNELRDPEVFRDGDDVWLLYSVAGEHGIGLARLSYQPAPDRP